MQNSEKYWALIDQNCLYLYLAKILNKYNTFLPLDANLNKLENTEKCEYPEDMLKSLADISCSVLEFQTCLDKLSSVC